MAIEINKHKEVYLDLAGVHISLLGNLLLQVIQQDETTLDAFSVELVSTLLYTHIYLCIRSI